MAKTVQYRNLNMIDYTVEWRLWNLPAIWNQSNYFSTGVSQFMVGNGASNLNAVGYYVFAEPIPVSGGGYYTDWETLDLSTNLVPGQTFTLNGFYGAQSTGKFYPNGSASFIIPNARPNNWTGFDWITSGHSFIGNNGFTVYPMTAALWNQFTSRVDEFRLYAGFSTYGFTRVYSEDDFTADIINEAILAVNPMSAPQDLVYTGQAIYADVFQTLAAHLNSV